VTENRKVILMVVIAIVGVLSILLLKTPIYGETQLMNKIYLMLMICYFVLDQFVLIMQFIKKQIKFTNIFKHYLFFFSITAFILMLINRCVDSTIANVGFEMSNSTCFFLTLVFVFSTWSALKLLNRIK
jgi:hypothetical protein